MAATSVKTACVWWYFFTLAGMQAVNGLEDKAFWFKSAQEELQRALGLRPNTKVAKNVIFMMGDGMGISTITAARFYKGQKAGQRGEDYKLNMETLPNAAFSKTYSTDRQVPESAATASAMVSGVKANYGTLGVDIHVARGNCSLMHDPNVRTDTIMDWSLAEGKSVGIVTTSRLTHASPAAVFAHTPDREWERDRNMPQNLTDGHLCADIALQLVTNNSNIHVVLGGGRRSFQDRLDRRNLTSEWEGTQKAAGRKARYITTASELRNMDVTTVDYVLGLFTDSHMSYELSRKPSEEPSLAEMTQKAIQILKKNDKGFFLFVEGARMDHAHHSNEAKRALEDTVALDEAVGAAMKMSGDDTLLIVTADHSHPFNIVGYPYRGNPILGLVNPVDKGQEPLDGMPYSTLNYANGPGPNRTLNLSTVNTSADDFKFPRLVPFQEDWETHSGEDVAIFATGPMSHLFHGVHEQSYIAHVMAYASCVGRNKQHCQQAASSAPSTTSGATTPVLLVTVVAEMLALLRGTFTLA